MATNPTMTNRDGVGIARLCTRQNEGEEKLEKLGDDVSWQIEEK